MKSTTAHKISQRATPKDVFITPRALALKAIDMCQASINQSFQGFPSQLSPHAFDYWYDPFRNSAEGSYYSQFPEGQAKCWAEITEGRDFFTYNPVPPGSMMPARLVICSNPPYSMLDAVINRCIALNPIAINLLLGVNNLTARRLEILENAGYTLTNLHMCKIYKWFGMSFICNWTRDTTLTSCLGYDRIVWREPENEKKNP